MSAGVNGDAWVVSQFVVCGGTVAPGVAVLPEPIVCNTADLASIGDTSDFPSCPDGQLTIDDLLVFVNADGKGCD